MRTWKAVALAVLLAGCVTKVGTIDPQFRLGEWKRQTGGSERDGTRRIHRPEERLIELG